MLTATGSVTSCAHYEAVLSEITSACETIEREMEYSGDLDLEQHRR